MCSNLIGYILTCYLIKCCILGSITLLCREQVSAVSRRAPVGHVTRAYFFHSPTSLRLALSCACLPLLRYPWCAGLWPPPFITILLTHPYASILPLTARSAVLYYSTVFRRYVDPRVRSFLGTAAAAAARRGGARAVMDAAATR